MPTLSISLIVPAFNEEQYIGSCLEHAIAHAGDRLAEIIVVNNASTDATASRAAAFAKVRIVEESEKGLTRARQRGYLEASGDLLAYLDADTRMPAGWIETVVRAFEQDEKLVCLSGPYTYYDIPVFQRAGVWLYWRLLAMPTYWMTRYMTVGGNFVIRRSTVQQMGGFDTTIAFYGEDADIARRASEHGKVRFTMKLVMPTSGRRFHGQGFLRTAWTYGTNFMSIVFTRRPATQEYRDIR